MADDLLHYRVRGGPANVDQRLTVSEDGTVELDERHRSRDAITLHLDPIELDVLRAAIDRVPTERWSTPARLALARFGHRFKFSLGRVEPGADARIRRGGKALGGRALEDPNVQDLFAQLDELRIRAMKSEPR